jgi:hypothetical protein
MNAIINNYNIEGGGVNDVVDNAINYIDTRYVTIFVICILVIFLYGRYRCANSDFQDPLQGSIIPSMKNHDLDGWSAVHFLFYMFVGYLYPDSIVLTLTLSILWEIFELYVGIHKPEILRGWGFCDSMTGNSAGNTWWYGKWTDLLMNLTGFLTGRYLSRHNYQMV